MSSVAPRYVQIFTTLSRRMETGKYSVDTRLPTESELCDEINASRFTVREALRRLVEQGMVQRRQGAGSIVISATPQARYVHSLSSLSDLFQFALDTDYELLSIERVTLDAGTAADVGGSAGEVWHVLKGLRRKGGKIVCYLHSYISPRAGKFVRELRRCVGPFYAPLSERTGGAAGGVAHGRASRSRPLKASISARLLSVRSMSSQPLINWLRLTGSIANLHCRSPLVIVCCSRSIVSARAGSAVTEAAKGAMSSSEAIAARSPFFTEFWAKMSPKDGATTQRMPESWTA